MLTLLNIRSQSRKGHIWVKICHCHQYGCRGFMTNPSSSHDLNREGCGDEIHAKTSSSTSNPIALPSLCLTVILRGPAGYELIYITNEAIGRVGYYQLISGKSEKNNCFSKFSSNSLDFFGWNLLKSWHFLYRRRGEEILSDLQTFSTRN